MVEFIVRPIQAKDKQQWKELFAGVDGYIESSGEKVSDEALEVTFKRFLDPNFQMWSAVVVNSETDEVVGFVDYLSHYHTWEIEQEVYLNDLFVRSDARLAKCGQKLIQFVYDHADKMGTPLVYFVYTV